MISPRFVISALLAVSAVVPQALAQDYPVDAFSAQIETEDAERFVELWEATGGMPSAEQLQSGYIDPGSRAIEIFTPGRITDGERLARVISLEPALYRDAVERCLPWVGEMQGQLRSTYLAMRGLLPEAELPRIAVVFGVNNSGGTAGPDMQVLGIEVLCRMAPDRAAFESLMRRFFAHETVHTFQQIDRASMSPAERALAAILAEGTADYIATLVTGSVPDPERDAWAREREEFVWEQFASDVAAVRQPDVSEEDFERIGFRWVGNAGSPPEGWPSELGYWVGAQIARGYVENADDPREAIRELLRLSDPAAIILQSGYAPRIFPEGG